MSLERWITLGALVCLVAVVVTATRDMRRWEKELRRITGDGR